MIKGSHKKLVTEFRKATQTEQRKGTGVGIGKLNESQDSDKRQNRYKVDAPVALPEQEQPDMVFSQI